MNSAAAAAALLVEANNSAAPSVDAECLRDILIRRPPHNFMRHRLDAQRLPIPRRSPATNPVIAELVNTVVQARDRKRQREEALYSRRDVGQQTAQDDVAVEHGDGISATKRVRREEETSRETRQVMDSSTNVDPCELPAPPTPDPVAHTTSNSASTSSSGLPSAAQDAQRMAQRIQRRAQRTRRIQQAETMRLHMEHPSSLPYLQQINGIVPTDHNCDIRCRHAPVTGPHSVSPTVAPHMHLRHPLQATAYPLYTTFPLLNTTTQLVPTVMMNYTPPQLITVPSVPVPAPPPPSFPNIYGFAPSVTISPMPHPDYFASFLRSHQDLMLPSFERMGLDRHHMFAGLDLDVPIGASKVEIDSFTKSEAYKKVEDEEETCTVCLSSFEDGEKIRKLPCNHFFHSDCIDKWLDINKRCPMCRDEIDRNRVAA